MAKRAKSKPPPEIEIQRPSALPVHAPPVPFASILGHAGALSVLSGAIRSGRVHHAWAFHGPRGVGKFTAALAFAALLLDPSTAPNPAGDPEASAQSPIQRLLRSGTHPDLHIITKELARFSDDPVVRERKLITIPKEVIEAHLIRPASRAPSILNGAAASKVFIIDEAELMDRSLTYAPTQNSILKTMEEPDGRTVIILVTSSAERLVATIRSRCQSVRFTPLDDGAMKAWVLTQHLDLDRAHRDWLVEYADGSPGEFLAALATGAFEWHSRLAPLLNPGRRGAGATGIDALALPGAIVELVDAYEKSALKANPQSSKEAATRTAAARIFRMLAAHYRRSLRSSLPRNVNSLTHAPALGAIDAIRQAERLLAAQVQLPFVAQWLAGELASPSSEPVVHM